MNILYFHTHDLGRTIQPYGYAVATPNYQRLAEQGTLFRNAYCAAPTCSPSRAALLTGQYPHQCGMFGLTGQGWRLSDYTRHLASFLGRHGFETAIVGSHHVVSHDEEGYRTLPYHEKSHLDARTATGDRNTTTEAAIGFLQAQHAKPFFLAVGYDFNHHHRWEQAVENSMPLWGPVDDRYVRPYPRHPDVPEARHETARFYRAVSYVDHLFGRIMGALDDSGLADETLVIMTTDHGIGMPFEKKHLLEGGVGVSLIIRGPGGFRGGTVSEALVHHVDLYPTICELLGLDPPAWLEGRSIVPLAAAASSGGEIQRRADTAFRDAVFLEQHYHGVYVPLRGLRSHRYKYIRRIGPARPERDYDADAGETCDYLVASGWGDDPMPEEQLYDLATDPVESRNLVAAATADPDGMLGRALTWHRTRLDRYMRETSDPALAGAIPPPPIGVAE